MGAIANSPFRFSAGYLPLRIEKKKGQLSKEREVCQNGLIGKAINF
jgi:hypothetical protein